MNDTKWVFILILSLIVYISIIYFNNAPKISEQEAKEIAETYLEHTQQERSYLLHKAYLLIKENITEEDLPPTEDKYIWYLNYMRDAQHTAVFYISAHSGDLIKGYIINRQGEILVEF